MALTRAAESCIGLKNTASEQADGSRDRQANKGNKFYIDGSMADPSSASSTGGTAFPALGLLGDDVQARLAECAPTPNSRQRIDRCVIALRSIAAQLGCGWDVKPFGSVANGLTTDSSDLDATCCQSDVVIGEDSQRQAAEMLGDQLVPLLQAHPEFTVVEQILCARIPIIKLRFEGLLEVDLSCHNTKPVVNTRLLKAYNDWDTRVHQLAVAVKLWGRAAGISGSVKKLTSYAITLLVIYFMQVHPDVRLPVLPVDVFQDGESGETDVAVIHAKGSWQCSLLVAELLARFFWFYTKEFKWGTEVAAVRYGQRYSAAEAIFAKLRARQSHRLHIEDPYESERNLHGYIDEEHLRRVFGEAFRKVVSGHTPIGLTPLYGAEVTPFLPRPGGPNGPPGPTFPTAAHHKSKDGSTRSSAPPVSKSVGSSSDSTRSSVGEDERDILAAGKESSTSDRRCAEEAPQNEASSASPWTKWWQHMDTPAVAQQVTRQVGQAWVEADNNDRPHAAPARPRAESAQASEQAPANSSWWPGLQRRDSDRPAQSSRNWTRG